MNIGRWCDWYTEAARQAIEAAAGILGGFAIPILALLVGIPVVGYLFGKLGWWFERRRLLRQLRRQRRGQRVFWQDSRDEIKP